MTEKPTQSTATLWARFRFSVIGSLLSAPPPRGELKSAIQSLAEKIWTHPVTGRDVQYAATTIERWYYKARNEQEDPVRVLAARCPQRFRQGVRWIKAYRASAHAVPRPSALELPTALRQPGKCRERRPFARAAMLLLHRKTFHADPWDGAQATAAKKAPGRRACSPPP